MKIISEGQEINIPSVNVNDGIYDDQERVIGTFFGKPLYRKIIRKDMGNYTENSDTDVYVDSAIDTMVTMTGHYTTTSKYTLAINAYTGATYGSNDLAAVWYQANRYAVRIRGGKSVVGASLCLILEYTKTTDPGESRILTSEPSSDSLDAIGSSVASVASNAI